jgi:ABC-type glycerol-3-phosphate transport system substrate-binding protein
MTITRQVFVLMAVLGIGVAAAACAGDGQAGEVTRAATEAATVVDTPEPAETEVAVTDTPEPAEAEGIVTDTPDAELTVTFVSWAEDSFEVSALEELIRRFRADHPDVELECEIVTSVQQAEATGVCRTVEAGEP